MQQLSLQIDEALYTKLAIIAQEDRRSVNEQVMIAIQEMVRKRRKLQHRLQVQDERDANQTAQYWENESNM
ncbi:hypothetical protein BH10CHL1_BH10CHL1_11430 [soil metagenome]